MSEEYVRSQFEQKLSTDWLSATEIDWDNVRFREKVGVPFIRPTLDQVYSSPKGMSCFRDFYQVTIQVFTPVNKGAAPNILLCDSLLDIFRGKNVGGIIFNNGYSQRIGNEREWHHRNVILELYYDHNR